ncbi:hypothetical protein D3C71_1581400 [compost metagenome]
MNSPNPLLAALTAIPSALKALGSHGLDVLGYVLIGIVLAAWLTMPSCPIGAHRVMTAVLAPGLSWLPSAQWKCYSPDQGFVSPVPGWRSL